MPLLIDRVQTQMDVHSPEAPAATGAATGSGNAAPGPAIGSLEDERTLARRLRPVVLDVLRDHLRELERRGLL